MDAWDLIEEETIAIMTMSVDFGVTQVVDGNWGAHATIPKFVFDDEMTMYDYSCTPSKTAGRRNLKTEPSRALKEHDRRAMFAKHVAAPTGLSMDEYKDKLFAKITADSCEACATSTMRGLLADKFLDMKLRFVQKWT